MTSTKLSRRLTLAALAVTMAIGATAAGVSMTRMASAEPEVIALAGPVTCRACQPD